MPLLKSKALFFFFTPTTTSLCRRRFSSSPAEVAAKKLPTIRCINRIHSDYKAMAIVEAQKALREYLHGTKSLPFVFAELIANNSLFSLATLFPKVRYSVKTFPASFRGILSYEPINEFEFFFESIGVDYSEVHRFLPPKTYFFSQDSTALDAAIELSRFGFPWRMLGKLCAEEVSVFRKSPAELSESLCAMKERYGLDNLSVAGIVLAFPRLLSLEGEFGDDVDVIFDCLKRVFAGLGVESCVEGNVDAWYELCRKVTFFWDLGCEKRKVVDLMYEKIDIFLGCTREVLSRKFEYFSEFGTQDDVGLLLLQRPELLTLDLETPVVSVMGFLEHFGLEGNELQCIGQKYSHVLGRNRMANLPNVMKAMDLHEWCFDKIKSSNGLLLETYAISCPDEGVDKAFVDAWKRIESLKCSVHTMTKINFLKRIGFGDNIKTLKVLNRVRGVGDNLQERFDCLIRLGFKHSKICSMLRRAPDFLCQSPERLDEKVNFLCQEMGLPMQLLVAWPKFLQYDLDTRIKRRLGVLIWLKEIGLCRKYHSIPYTINSNEKRFIRRLYRIHPAVPKHYFERF